MFVNERIAMRKICRCLFILLCVTFLSISIVACSKITQENFDKIKNNMTMQEVIALLGEPTSSESINIAGISGTSAVWKDKNAEIDIQLLNDRVTVKAFSKVNEKDDQAVGDDKPGQ